MSLFAIPEHIRGDVLPVEQHAASDLPRLLHPDPHLKALIEGDQTNTDPASRFLEPRYFFAPSHAVNASHCRKTTGFRGSQLLK